MTEEFSLYEKLMTDKEELRELEISRLRETLCLVGKRVDITVDQASIETYDKLLRKPPPVLSRFQPLVNTVLASNDDYRKIWLGTRLKALYQGVATVNLTPGSWEDEYDFLFLL